MVDIGELLEAPENLPFYHLPDYYKKLPAQSILCKVKDLPRNEGTANFLNSNKYNTFQFEVVGVEK